MSELKDFIMGMQEDANWVINGCETFDQFCTKMLRIDSQYLPSLLSRTWQEHVDSQEDNSVNFYDRRAR
jgi:hypothetical protein